MRKLFNGLGELVQHALDENPFSGHLFIFRGRKGDTVKIFWASEVSAEQLELVSSALKVICTVRMKKACTRCDCIVEAAAPSRPIDRGIGRARSAGTGVEREILRTSAAVSSDCNLCSSGCESESCAAL